MLNTEVNKTLDLWIRDAVINAKDKMVNQRKAAIEEIVKREECQVFELGANDTSFGNGPRF